MRKLIWVVVVSVGFILFASKEVRAADEIEIPNEELATETVLPRFDRPDNVRNRNVVSAQRFEMGILYGSNFTEPVYNQTKLGFNLGYHLNEDHAVVFNFAKWNSGRNAQYVPSIEDQGNTGGSVGDYDFGRIPNLEYSSWINWEIKSYYGKISLTKEGTMNLSLYPIMGLGMTKFANKSYWGANFGVGQKFYWNKNWAFRADLKFQYQGQPDPFLGGNKLKNNQSPPDFGQFSDVYRLGTVLDFGISVLL